MNEIKIVFCVFCAAVTFLSLLICILCCVDARMQSAENIVIIEQLCNLDKNSYWCGKLK